MVGKPEYAVERQMVVDGLWQFWVLAVEIVGNKFEFVIFGPKSLSNSP